MSLFYVSKFSGEFPFDSMTACIERMDGEVDDAGAFCASWYHDTHGEWPSAAKAETTYFQLVGKDWERDEFGRFAETGGGGGSVETTGGGWTETTQAAADSGASRVKERWPAAPELDRVATSDHVGWGGKSIDAIYVNPSFHDDEVADKRQAEMAQFLAGDGSREDTIVHEYGHIMENHLPEPQREALNSFLNEPMEIDGREVPRHRMGLEAPSVYGVESQFEFVAEAVVDYERNGEDAHPSSVTIGRMMDDAYGGGQ